MNQNIIDKNKKLKAREPKTRECGLMAVAGQQSVGKSYLTMHIIKDYIRDKIESGVKGRKCLIFDINGEFVSSQWERNGIPNFECKTIAVKDVEAWGFTNSSECRRIDAKMLSIKEKQRIVEHLVKVYRNGCLVLEDINNYILSVTFMEDIVSGLINLRHRAVDVIVSYQSLRAIEPRIFANARYFRLHKQADNVDDVKGKLPNYTGYKLGQLIVNARFAKGDIRYYLYVTNFGTQLKGNITKEEFLAATKTYLSSKRKILKDCMSENDCSMEEAYQIKGEEYYNEFLSVKK